MSLGRQYLNIFRQVVFVESGSHYVALAGLEHVMKIKITSNLQIFACLYLPVTRSKSMNENSQEV